MIEPKHKLSIIVSFEGLKTVIHKVDDAYDTLSHSLLSEKNQDPDDYIFASNGRILNQDLSFIANNIKNGDKIIVCKRSKKPKPGERRKQLFEFLNRRRYNIDNMCQMIVMQNERERSILEKSRKEEISRLNDLAFSTIEMNQELPILLKGMIDEEYSELNTEKVEYTNVEMAQNLCEEPLPNPFITRTIPFGSFNSQMFKGTS